ncbi:MAG: hypothetical protein AAFQ87_24355 [Bacteroidota bacterium]
MKRWLLILMILSPVLCIVGVNEFSRTPSHQYEASHCTRYCHDKGCKHYRQRVETEVISGNLTKLYVANIRWLKQNPLGLSYQAMNLLLYVFIAPLLILLLIWGLIRERDG